MVYLTGDIHGRIDSGRLEPDRWPEMPTDPLERFLEDVDARLDQGRLKRWYFGHFHKDRTAGDEKRVCLYEQVVPLGGLPAPGEER